MATSFKVYRGSTLLADGDSAKVNGMPLPEFVRQMTEVQRPRAAQIAVVDFGNVSTSLRLAVTREFASEARAKDHALRAPQTGCVQQTLGFVCDDGTDIHTWTLSDAGGGGAAWKSAKATLCSGVRAEIEYGITGGLWTYDGPLAGTYSDAIEDAAPGVFADFSALAMNAAGVNAVLAAIAAGRGSVARGSINLLGANAAPTGGSGNADYLTLTGAGITVKKN